MNKEHQGEKIRGVEYDVVRGIEYDVVRGIEYDVIRGVTYDDDKENSPVSPKEEATTAIPGVTYDTVAVMDKLTTGNTSKLQAISSFSTAKTVRSGAVRENQGEVLVQAIAETGDLNFNLVLQHRVVLISDTEDGESMKYRYRISIIVRTLNGGRQCYFADVDSDKVKGLDWLKKATHSLAKLPRGKEEQAEYANIVQRCIESETADTELIYPNAGWRDIPQIGWRYVYGEGVIGDDKLLVHTDDIKYGMNVMKEKAGTSEIFKKVMGMTNICRNGVTSLALFLFLHASLLSSIFQEVGYPINFVFGIAGVTNSRKTSLVLAMTRIFGTGNSVADAEFATATVCGIEKVLSSYKDGVVLIDDFKPGVSIAQQRKMDEKLDQLVRYYGNRVPKKRMLDFSAERDKKFFPINGGCVLTMEIVTGVLSSITRMFITEIGLDDVDNRQLSLYQKENMLLPTHVYDFISWVTVRFSCVSGLIREQIPLFRGENNFETPRHNEMFATFMVIATIFAQYALERGFWQSAQAQEFVQDTRCKISAELNDLAVRLKRMDKGILVIQALVDAMKRMKLVPVWLSDDTAVQECDVYEDSRYLYIRCRELRKIANEYCGQYQEAVNIVNEDELLGLLEKYNALEIYQGGRKRERSRKLPIQHGNHGRYLWIKKGVLQEFNQQ